MKHFAARIPRRGRMVYGALGVLSVLVVWTVVTYPFFERVEIKRTAVKDAAGEFVRYDDEEIRRPRALVNPPAFETPARTLQKAGELNVPRHIWASTKRILFGFLLAALLAVPLGIAMGLFPRLHAFASPLISFLRPLPSICWVPLAVIWFGVDEVQKLFILFMGGFTAALLYTIEATLRVDPNLVRAARNLGATQRQLLRRVLLPAALPSILSGLKVVLAICWTCVISAEIVGTKWGLGAMIWTSMEKSDTAAIVVGLVCISGIVVLMDIAFGVVERLLLPYLHQPEARS